MREVHNKKIHSYPKDVLIAAVIFVAAVCQWGGNHGKAAETVSFAALEDIAEKKVAITFDDGPNPDVKPGIPRTSMGWAITGDALYWAVRFIHTRYEKPIMITENGMANVDFIMSDGLVHDQQRIEFLKLYLAGLKRAANEGYPIIGYMYWSILDNFEWAEGYDKRFGLVYVNYENQERMEKDSAIWFANYIKQQQDEQS